METRAIPIRRRDPLRLPDFLILGPMKAGTTSLFGWLGKHPRCRLPDVKEIMFFRFDERWGKGLEWYGRHFEGIPSGYLTGEASNYVDPRFAAKAAARIHRSLPDARLIFIVRDRVDRLRSNYRHEVRMGRESRPLLEALEDLSVVYIRRSQYCRGVEPFLQRFEENLCFLDFDQLFHPPHRDWRGLLEFLGLEFVEPPIGVHAGATDGPGRTRLMRWLVERNLAKPMSVAPGPLKRLGRPFLVRDDRRYAELMKSSEAPLPPAVRSLLDEDEIRLTSWISRQAVARTSEV